MCMCVCVHVSKCVCVHVCMRECLLRADVWCVWVCQFVCGGCMCAMSPMCVYDAVCDLLCVCGVCLRCCVHALLIMCVVCGGTY
jgi:hypothetical protein